MIVTDNTYPNTARLFSSTFTGNAETPFDFFMARRVRSTPPLSPPHP
jgi:hypothetical protein